MEDWTRKPLSYLVATLCICYVPLASCLLTADMKLEIVNLHNSLRRGFAQGSEGVLVSNMKQLVWNRSLEEEARRKLRLHCRLSFFHFPSSNKYSNIARNSNGNFTSDILHWYSGIKTGFYPEYNLCYPEETCSHATSMLDSLHRYIGCSFRRRCQGESDALLCLYENDDSDNPDTLTVTEFYKRGALCTHCPYPTSFCDDGLCTSCDSSAEHCDCRKGCYSRGNGAGILNQTTCSCTCQYGRGLNCDEPCANEAAGDFEYDYDICTTVSPEDCDDPLVQSFCASSCNRCDETFVYDVVTKDTYSGMRDMCLIEDDRVRVITVREIFKTGPQADTLLFS